ncbi:hypothetical protein VNI00_013340 [Paramarasmius palmivorus]|uniref:DUF6534 domain-containing protein n=1 Tax=Paramarasmius palmivorus TaxID=297713 RepID=A0AAW0C3D4_9AGAR
MGSFIPTMAILPRAVGSGGAILPPTAEQIAMAKTVESIYGPTIIGILFAMILYGVSITQMYFYLNAFKEDKWWMKYLVRGFFDVIFTRPLICVVRLKLLSLFILDTSIVALDFQFLYETLVKHFGFSSTAMKAGWAFGVNRGLTGLVGAIVQCFFAWRVQKLTGVRTLCALIVALSLVGLGGSIALAITLAQVTFADFDAFKTSAIVWLIATAVADVAITFCLVWFLRSKKGGIKQSNQVIDRIIRLTMETGALTTIFAIMDLICYLTMGNVNGAHITFQVILSKLYINSLLASLNSRSGNWSSSKSNSGTTKPGDAYAMSNRIERIDATQVYVTVDHEVDGGSKGSCEIQDRKMMNVSV